jgi:hypothetical protein
MRQLWILVLAALVVVPMLGCGEGGPSPAVEKDRTVAATRMRELFDKAAGNYEALSEAEKKEWLDMFKGNEKDAQQTWAFMRDRPTGGATTPGAAGMPGGQ